MDLLLLFYVFCRFLFCCLCAHLIMCCEVGVSAFGNCFIFCYLTVYWKLIFCVWSAATLAVYLRPSFSYGRALLIRNTIGSCFITCWTPIPTWQMDWALNIWYAGDILWALPEVNWRQVDTLWVFTCVSDGLMTHSTNVNIT